jgi:glycosyltransferase involved in cell wall biosynthesis
MKISIITVVFNNPKIKDALDSIFRQTLDGEIESVVVDGGSTDGTVQVVQSYGKVHKFISERDRGIYDAMNKGIAIASGDILGTLNSDDFYAHDQVLQNVLEAFKDPNIDIVYGNLEYVSALDPSKVIRHWRSRPFQPGLFERGWMPPHPTFFVRRKVYEAFGTFNLDYKIAADFELTLRFLARYRIPSKHLDQVLIKFRMGGASNQILANILRANMESRRACLANNLSISPFFIFQKIGSKIPQFFLRKP